MDRIMDRAATRITGGARWQRSLPSLSRWGLLRLYRFDDLSLWLDEGFTVYFSRLPWFDVLGFGGEYDPHPPLYYVLVKLVALAVPDLQAGRLLSVLTGTATILVLYFIVARLMHPPAGIIAALLLAVSPLHYWYSQEARQYAPMTLAIGIAYLALIEFNRRPGWGWATGAGFSALAAIYIDYSAIFALVPAVGAGLLIIYRKRREAAPLVAAGIGALVGFLPWLPQARASAEREGADRAWYLGVSLDRVQNALLSIAGLHGRGLYYWGDPAPWERWPDLRLLLFGLLLAISAGGLIALGRRSLLSVVVVAGLAGGTVLVAACLSLLSPAFAERTILPATLGWSALVACLPFATSHRVGRLAGVLVVIAWFGLSLVTLDAVRDGDKQHWEALAADADRAADYGWPVVMAPAVSETLIKLYAPELRNVEQLTMGGYGAAAWRVECGRRSQGALVRSHRVSREQFRTRSAESRGVRPGDRKPPPGPPSARIARST
ncbi:MAG: glycosyltransferase family 39 protein [Thermomicrobiales bacterium]